MAKRDEGIAKFLSSPFICINQIVVRLVVLLAKGEHCVIAWVRVCPAKKAACVQMIFIIFTQFLQRGTCYVEQFQFHFTGCTTIFNAFHDVLFARSSCLHHLIYGAVAIFGQKSTAEYIGELIDGIGLLIDKQFGVGRVLPQHSLL